MIVRFPLLTLKRAAKRSAYFDQKEAEAIASKSASEITGIKAPYGYPKFSEDIRYEEDDGSCERVD